MSEQPSASENWRLFIAIAVPEEVKSAIGRVQSQLRAVVPDADISWTKREQFHLTLKFLGAIAASETERLFTDVKAACRPFRPVHLAAKGAGFFPERREPRVVWVGVDDADGTLLALQEAIDKATTRYCEADRHERFTGHITLGRVRRIKRADTDALKSAADEFSVTVVGEWTAPAVEIMRSQLSSAGARHESVCRVVLDN